MTNAGERFETRASMPAAVNVISQGTGSGRTVLSAAVALVLVIPNATFPDLGDRMQTRGTIGIYYALLGNDRFSAVDWR